VIAGRAGKIHVMNPLSRLALPCLAVLLFLACLSATRAHARADPPGEPLALPTAVAGPRVALETSQGRIVLELYPDKSPATVANFLSYVRDGHYNGTVFHRVVADFLLQGGDYTADLQTKPERAPIRNEANNGLSNLRGTISAARKRGERDSTRSQFFINTVDNRQLDYRGEQPAAMTGFCVFGRVVEGMDVVDKIRTVATGKGGPLNADVPLVPVLIERASVLDANR
jgi:cyclophilin family peptidyl-prolyl cis-trans isomerase